MARTRKPKPWQPIIGGLAADASRHSGQCLLYLLLPVLLGELRIEIPIDTRLVLPLRLYYGACVSFALKHGG